MGPTRERPYVGPRSRETVFVFVLATTVGPGAELFAALLPAMADCCCQNLSDQLLRNMEVVADILLGWCSVFRASELEVMLE